MRDALRHQRYPARALRQDLGITPNQPDIYGTLINFIPIDEDLDFAGRPIRKHHLGNSRVEDFLITVMSAGRIPTFASISTLTGNTTTRRRWSSTSSVSCA